MPKHADKRDETRERARERERERKRAHRVHRLEWAGEELVLRVKHAVYGSTQTAFQVEVPAALLPADARGPREAAFVCVDYQQAWDQYYDAPDWLARYKSAHAWDVEDMTDEQIIADNEKSRAFNAARLHDMDPAQGVLGSKQDGPAKARLTAHTLIIERADEEAGALTVARPLRMLLYVFWELPIRDERKHDIIGGARVASVRLDCRSV